MSTPITRPAGIAALLTAVAVGPQTGTQSPVLIADIDARPIEEFSSQPEQFVRIGDWIYFAATTHDRGKELYRTTGLPGSTQLVKDINPGRPSSLLDQLIAVGDTLFFRARDDQGVGLWKSDGTGPGTVLVKAGNYGYRLAAVGDTLFFFSDDGIWKSDGTEAGTVRLASVIVPSRMTVAGSNVFFSVNGPHGGLWKSDGTVAGTGLVRDPLPVGLASITDITARGDEVFFGANDGVHGSELWKSDGTFDGTVMVVDLVPGAVGSGAANLLVAGDLVFFRANVSTSPSGPGEIFRSDGTAAGTFSLGTYAPVPSLRAALDGKVIFTNYYQYQGAELWVSDGTVANTSMLAEFVFPILEVRATGGRVWFSAFDFAAGQELWTTDLTPEGTFRVADIAPGSPNSLPANMIADAAGTRVIVSADDGSTGREPWVATLGGGAQLLADVNPAVPGATESSDPEEFVDAYGIMLFSAAPIISRQLWATDGSGPGTVPLAAEDKFEPHFLQVVGDQAFLSAELIGGWRGLYVANPSGTHPLGTYSAYPSQLEGLRNQLLFTGRFQDGNWYELYRSDGTTVELVKDINPGRDAYSHPDQITAVGPRAFFAAEDYVIGRELWWTDGTFWGTDRVRDIRPGPEGSMPRSLTRVGDLLCFAADDGINGAELWCSDGSWGATYMVSDIAPGPQGSEPTEITAVDGTVYFAADDGITGIELWRSDGTPAGTRRVADLVPGGDGSEPRSLTAVGDRLFFTADDWQHGREVWVTDASGTRMVSDIRPGPRTSDPRLLTAVGSQNVWFAADDGIHGSEMWRSDGTMAGTVLVHDLWPGDVSSDISDIVLSQGNVIFGADDGIKGVEPWRVFPGATAQEIGEGCGVLGRTPRLRATDPVIGSTSTVVGRGAVPGVPLFLALGLRKRPMSVTAAGLGCYVYLDLDGPLALVPIMPAGSDWTAQLPIPALPSLTGASFVLQAAQGPTAAPLGFDLSNGVLLTLGAPR